VPALRGLAIADVCARLPQGMVTVTLLLVAGAGASMTTAGLVVTGYTLGQALTGPLRGRLADRRGLVAVSAVCGGVYALALLGLLAGSLARGPAWLLVAAAAVAGLSVPPLSPGMRGLWSALADGALRQAAFALDAAVFDLAYITGPVVASSLAAGLAPAAAVGLLIALTGAAIVIIGARAGSPAPGSAEPSPAGSGQASPGVASPGVAGSGSAGSGGAAGGQPATARRSLLGALNSGPLRRLLVTGALVNVALSATEVALTAYVRQRHALWASGPLLAEVSVGSIAGSLLLGARAAAHGASPAAAARRLPRLLACYALGLAVLAAAALQPPLIAVAAPLAGLCLGPSLATLFGLTPGRGPGRGTEAQAWLNSAMNGGAAAGAALAGATADRPALSLAITAGVAAIAAVSGAGRSRGQPRTGPQRVASVVSSLLLRDVLR
jgi:MFS family permease